MQYLTLNEIIYSEIAHTPVWMREKGMRLLQNDAVEWQPQWVDHYDKNSYDDNDDDYNPDYIYHVLSESYRDHFYLVELDVDHWGGGIFANCDCPYFEEHDNCKHVTASLLALLNAQHSQHNNHNAYPGGQYFMPELSKTNLKNAFGTKLLEQSEKLLQHTTFDHLELSDGHLEARLTDHNGTIALTLDQPKGSPNITADCACGTSLCIHVLTVLLHQKKKKGIHAFQESHNWDKEKQDIYANYGLNDNSGAITFSFLQGKLVYDVHVPDLLPADVLPNMNQEHEHINTPSTQMEKLSDRAIGYFLCSYMDYRSDDTYFSLKTGIGKIGKSGKFLKSGIQLVEHPLQANQWLSLAGSDDQSIVQGLEAFQSFNPLEIPINISQYRYKNFKALLPQLKDKTLFWASLNISYHSQLSQLTPLNIGEGEVTAYMKCTGNNDMVTVKVELYLNGQAILPDPYEPENVIFMHHRGYYYPWRSVYDCLAYLITSDKPAVNIGINHWDDFKKNNLDIIRKYVTIETNSALMETAGITTVELSRKIVLSETSGFLLIYPVIAYNDTEINALEDGLNVYDQHDRLIKRDHQQEQELLQLIASTHPRFHPDTFQDFFHVPIQKVMENHWFLDFYQVCQDNGIEVYGIDKLKKVQYSPVRPTIKYNVSSGTDWFDVNLSMDFDQEHISLKQLRKTVVNNQNLVKLGNGKYGIIPEEWLNRLKAMLRYGKVKEEGVQLRKSQFVLIDTLFDELEDPALLQELAEKRKLLQDFDSIGKVPQPENISAEMRNYQQAGLNWLAFLAETEMGGCLADDMGLGKTLQMIALLAHLKEKDKRKKQTTLVVCPTSLVFNWQNELDKFAPKLSYTIHWGKDRQDDPKEWKKKDVVITSYGTLVNDIEQFRKLSFAIVVLDESQAIKNPASLRYKAVCLLKSRQRFVMTGTPIENNTVELFAQMNFLNPGLLGNLNSFRKEFAGSIEQTRDQQKLEELRSLINPFILRRTKEQVMTELPDKTETVHYCEMSDEQRKVYDAFKNDFREQILDEIEEEGLNKSRFTILEGLTKMRQICDSPALLSTREGYGNDSIKADELMRLLTTKISDHKALVFSQFLGMLDIIEERLKKAGIKYSRLTGQTRDRKKAVEAFEDDPQCKVFLISLKAGGQGLNLISADYVFLVDPWWNPAVENQAIDRAHRMGQTKKVFAYRMVCKDTVEEKIVELQQRKKQLADDLITSEQGFVKALTKADIEGLFR